MFEELEKSEEEALRAGTLVFDADEGGPCF
jgi:hypothetical protein